MLSVPGNHLASAVAFLQELGGPTAGAGRALDRSGVEAPKLRKVYKIEIDAMVSQIARRLSGGEPKESIARWASAERVRIAERARASSGVVGRAVYTIRDWRKYGLVDARGQTFRSDTWPRPCPERPCVTTL